MKLTTLLINLDDSTERLARAQADLDGAGIPFQRVSAYDARQMNPLDIPGYDEEGALGYMGRKLKGGELGCYMSHLDCAKRFLATDADYAVVLEDDMTIAASDARQVIHDVLTYLESQHFEWYLINIGALKRKIFTPLQSFDGHQLSRAHYFPMTTTGLIWTRAGAEAFIRSYKPIFAPVDNYFRHWLTDNNKGLSLFPPIVVPSGAESEIDGTAAKRKTTGRSPLHGLLKQRRLWGDKIKALSHKLRT